jgi:hypothetical protein
MGTIVNIGGNFEQPAHGSPATMVSEPGSPLLGVGSAVIFFILAADADAWACHNFFGMKLASVIY